MGKTSGGRLLTPWFLQLLMHFTFKYVTCMALSRIHMAASLYILPKTPETCTGMGHTLAACLLLVAIWSMKEQQNLLQPSLSVQLTFPALLWSRNVLWCLMSSSSIHFHPLQEASYNADQIRHTTAKVQKERNKNKTVNRLRRHAQSFDPLLV